MPMAKAALSMTTDSSNIIRWGLMGPGRIAQTFAQACHSVESARLIHVHSSVKSRAQDFARQYSIKSWTSHLDDLLDDPDIDVIYIAYPHSMHFEAIKICLNHNKHVLCEKPLTVSAAQAQEVCQLAQSKQRLLMEALWTRLLPVWQQVKRWLDGGRIGEIVSIRSSFGFNSHFDPSSRLFNPQLAGGALWDLGIYPISMSQFVMAQQGEVASATISRGATAVDEHCDVLLHYPNQATSHFTVSFRESLDNHFLIEGKAGQITIDAPFWGAEVATLESPSGQVRYYQAHRVNGFEYQIEHVNQLIMNHQIESPIVPWQDTIESQKILDQLLQY